MVGANGPVNQTAPGPVAGIKKEPGVNTGELLGNIIRRQPLQQRASTGLDADLTPDDEEVFDDDDGEEPPQEGIKQEDPLNDLFQTEGQMDDRAKPRSSVIVVIIAVLIGNRHHRRQRH